MNRDRLFEEALTTPRATALCHSLSRKAESSLPLVGDAGFCSETEMRQQQSKPHRSPTALSILQNRPFSQMGSIQHISLSTDDRTLVPSDPYSVPKLLLHTLISLQHPSGMPSSLLLMRTFQYFTQAISSYLPQALVRCFSSAHKHCHNHSTGFSR